MLKRPYCMPGGFSRGSFGGVDIGGDGLDRFGVGGVGLHLFFYFGDRVDDCGVVPAAEESRPGTGWSCGG